MKKLATIAIVTILSGCATHANITMPVVEQVHDKAYDHKSIGYEILYSQPKPGIFSGGEQLPLAPLSQAELSVASAITLKKLPDYIYQQLPSTVARVEKNTGDYELVVELTAHDKKGPAYADYEAAKSFGKDLITLGLASSEYNIIADFDAVYVLYKGKTEVFTKHYKVNESVDHEKGDFESYNSLNEYTGDLLEKHLVLTLNDFFKGAAKNL